MCMFWNALARAEWSPFRLGKSVGTLVSYTILGEKFRVTVKPV